MGIIDEVEANERRVGITSQCKEHLLKAKQPRLLEISLGLRSLSLLYLSDYSANFSIVRRRLPPWQILRDLSRQNNEGRHSNTRFSSGRNIEWQDILLKAGLSR